MSIQLTENAAQRVKQFLDKENGVALRLGARMSTFRYPVALSHFEISTPMFIR